MKFSCYTEFKRMLKLMNSDYNNMIKIIHILSSFEFISDQINQNILFKKKLLDEYENISYKIYQKPLFLSQHPLAIEYQLLLQSKDSLEKIYLSNSKGKNTIITDIEKE